MIGRISLLGDLFGDDGEGKIILLHVGYSLGVEVIGRGGEASVAKSTAVAERMWRLVGSLADGPPARLYRPGS